MSDHAGESSPHDRQSVTLEDLWGRVPGQSDAVEVLRASSANPTHAYLISGPEGSGKSALATAFAASLLAAGVDTEDSLIASRVARGDHPGVVVFEREGQFLSADEARRVVERAARTPIEGARQVIVLPDFHLVRDAGPMLLKSIEEPPESTIFILLAEELPRELETIESRCVTINLHAVPVAVLAEHLVSEGVAADVATQAAQSAGGSISRARLLARDPAVVERRDRWYQAPGQLDGSGARASEVTDELLSSIAMIEAPLAELEAEELAAFEQRMESSGLEPAKGDLKRIKDRYKRLARRLRTEELRVGLAVLVARYRDALADGLNPDLYIAVAESVQELCENLVFNVSEDLALKALLVNLPALPDELTRSDARTRVTR